ncbi:MAG: hypothetical protein P8L44_20980 [Opitutales bacterium]|nr:hypothetical protein [Opitutales bacterium]
MPDEACEAFLNVADKFKLGTLETEKPHPLTENLSKEVHENLTQAISSLKAVDSEALERLREHLPQLGQLRADIWETLRTGGNIYLCGCGATGRLSISLEVFCRQGLVPDEYQDRFIGFMAGGDAALIKSIENFEDFPEYGKRQLLELGYSENDLLISTTEGGETPFVIGATEAATTTGKRNPWFIHCNPDDQLIQEVERSRRVIQNPNINNLSLFVGSMGLSGSTRMQASTVLMAAVGWAIRFGDNKELIAAQFEKFLHTWEQLDLSPLAAFIESEADTYSQNEFVIYETESYAVTVLTDTTERSPTFSLPPFENETEPADPPAWCYLSIPSAIDSLSAWEKVLERSPRCLEWEGIDANTEVEYLNGFYIDQSCQNKRSSKTLNTPHQIFEIKSTRQGIELRFREHNWNICASELEFFELNLLLKLILNIHSTLIMGRLNRFESNLMTYVKPTNFKLIDRTIRYVQRLAELRGSPKPSYEGVARKLFAVKDKLSNDEAIVLRLLEELDIG